MPGIDVRGLDVEGFLVNARGPYPLLAVLWLGLMLLWGYPFLVPSRAQWRMDRYFDGSLSPMPESQRAPMDCLRKHTNPRSVHLAGDETDELVSIFHLEASN